MNALTGISLWIALVTVVPGLVTVATIFGALKVATPGVLLKYATSPEQISVWVWTAFVVTIMVLTQALGILLEEILVNKRLLGSSFTVNKGKESEQSLSVYDQYNNLYFLLAQIRSDEDTQGHLQRAIAQYFLTNNTLVSFSISIIVTLLLALSPKGVGISIEVVFYTLFLIFSLGTSYVVAIIRFREMAKSIWATERARGQSPSTHAEDR
ncbi:MAG: hypothetical protein PVG99_10010 [Desulfobacteraceae bacterium]|jgi:hypothetical protein